MHRRLAVFHVALLPVVAVGQIQPPDRSTLLASLARAIGAAADALNTLASSFEVAASDLRVNYSPQAADRELDHLKNLSRLTTGLIAANVAAIGTLEDYLQAYEARVATQQQWRQTIRRLEGTLDQVKRLLSDVQRENSDFVLEPAFLTLNESLAERSALLQRISAMPPPAAPEEVAQLRLATQRYRELVAGTRRSLTALNSYITNRAAAPRAASSVGT